MQHKKRNFLRQISMVKKMDVKQIRKLPHKQEIVYDFVFHKLFEEKKKTLLLAEIKFASPVTPHLGNVSELVKRAKQYEASGADAISIITENHFFNGDVSFIAKVKKQVAIPVLQKDFVVDQQQIYEAHAVGANALLLIARLVSSEQLRQFVTCCLSLGIEPVVEINNEADLEKAVATRTRIIAVNARNLETFAIDVKKACMLCEKIPDTFIILGFSGIHSRSDVLCFKQAGAAGVLVGTGLMKTNDIAGFIQKLDL